MRMDDAQAGIAPAARAIGDVILQVEVFRSRSGA
jgi:hypothetical protein